MGFSSWFVNCRAGVDSEFAICVGIGDASFVEREASVFGSVLGLAKLDIGNLVVFCCVIGSARENGKAKEMLRKRRERKMNCIYNLMNGSDTCTANEERGDK